MAERDLPDQLNESIDRLLANAPAPGAEQDPLVQLAADPSDFLKIVDPVQDDDGDE